MGSESLILLCQFESICLSCFRIVIDFLLFSLIFFFFQCFSMTTLTVIIKSAFDLFWLPRSPSWITLLHDVFTTRLFYFYGAQVWFLRNFCTLNHLNFALFSKSRHHFFVNDFISTNVTLHQRVHIREQKEQRSFCNDGPGIKSFRNTVLEYEPLADWSILCLCTDAPHPPPHPHFHQKKNRGEGGRLPPRFFLREVREGGGRLYTGYLILTFRWASQYSLSSAKIVNLRIFIYTWRASNEGLFWKSTSKPSLKITPCQTADNVKTTGHNIKWDHFEIKGRRVNQINWIVTDCKTKDQGQELELQLLMSGISSEKRIEVIWMLWVFLISVPESLSLFECFCHNLGQSLLKMYVDNETPSWYKKCLSSQCLPHNDGTF